MVTRTIGAAALALMAAANPLVANAQSTLIEKVKTARALFDIGIAEGDGLMVLTAAKLRKSVPLKATDRAPKDGAKGDGAPDGWRAMLAAAGPLIAGDPSLEGLAADIEAARTKGVSDGPVYSIAVIAAGGTDLYPGIPFDGGTYAEIYIEGPAGADLNLFIRDAQDRLVCSDSDISAIAYCGWRPAETGTYTISVVSEAGPGGRYSLISN